MLTPPHPRLGIKERILAPIVGNGPRIVHSEMLELREEGILNP